MKKYVFIAFVFTIGIAALPTAYDETVSAQTAQEPAPAAQQPVQEPVPAPTTEAQPAPETMPQPEAKPVEKAEKPKKEPVQKAVSQKQPHKDFAEMKVGECSECHKGEGIAPTHGADWLREHRVLAEKTDKNCKECHGQSFCLDCHKGGGLDVNLNTGIARSNTAPMTHRTDFRELHPIKALDNPQSCYRCHDSRFCSGCHAKFKGEDLRVLSHRRSWSDLEVTAGGPVHSTFTEAQCQTCHPGGLLPKIEWSSDHAREARRNLQACQTCHGDGEICMTCHSARRGLMVNPHPRNWNAVKDKYRSKSGGRSCIKCHDNY